MTAGTGSESPRHPLRIFIVAGEASGDHLGAALIDAIRADAGNEVQFSGVGGAAMAARGVRSLISMEDVSIVGFSNIFKNLNRILRHISYISQVISQECPDALVIIDSPEFTHRIARKVRHFSPDIPIVDYVSPSVWAWRPWRAKAMRSYVDHVLALLPFEVDVHRRLGGPPCSYVGHPLSEQVDTLRPSAPEQARRQAEPPVVLLLPGSRSSEIAALGPVFGETVARLAGRGVTSPDFVLPTLPHLADRIGALVANWPVRPRIAIGEDEKRAAFRVARAALAASGTVTLELALAGIPTVAAYRVSALEAFVARRLVKSPSVILANLVIGENVVPEFLQEDCTAASLAAALAPLLADTPERTRQLAAFARLDGIMKIGEFRPSDEAARIVLSYARNGRRTAVTPA